MIHVLLNLVHIPPFDAVIQGGNDIAMAHLIRIAQALKDRFTHFLVRDVVLIINTDLDVIVLMHMTGEKELGERVSLDAADDMKVLYLHARSVQSSLRYLSCKIVTICDSSVVNSERSVRISKFCSNAEANLWAISSNPGVLPISPLSVAIRFSMAG